MPNVTLGELAHHLGATLERATDLELVLTSVATPETAQASELIFLLDVAWLEAVVHSDAQVVLLTDSLFSEKLQHKILLRVPHVRKALAQALAVFFPTQSVSLGNWHPSAQIDLTAQLAPDVHVGALTYIGPRTQVGALTRIYPQVYIGSDVVIGRDCIIHPQVVIHDGSVIGDEVVLHSGVVIGADGYGFYQEAGKHYKIPQVGSVRIENRVEIGANSTVDRATVGQTVVGAGTKIDNLVQIGHNVQIDQDCLIVAQTGLAGSVRLGQRVTLAGQVGVAGHLSLGNDVVVAGKSGVTQNIPAGLRVAGFPAQEHRQEMRLQAILRKLPELWQRLKRI